MSKRRFPTDLETAQSLNKVQREELARLRWEAAQKDATSKVLADALEVVIANAEDRGLQWRVHMSPVQMDAVTAALRLAGRLP